MITAADIKALEQDSPIPASELMETAGKKVAETIKEKHDLKNKRVLVACYHGNNGGDGLVAAHHLANEAEVDVLFLGEEERLKKEAATNFKRVENNVSIQFVQAADIDFDDYDIVVDAILGLGAKGKLPPEMETIIKRINNSKPFKVAVDVPTGMDADTGRVEGESINPDMIITFHDLKPGLQQFNDKVKVVDIGL